MLTALVFVPVVGALAVLCVPRANKLLARRLALAVSLVSLLIAVVMAFQFEYGSSAMQFVQRAAWIPALNISYHLGVDGISFPLAALTTLLTTLSIAASFKIEHRVKQFMAFILLLETGVLGVFTSLDYILFYVFWDIVLIPIYFLIGIWGGPRKEYAALKFLLYTLLGSVLMLVGILALYIATGARTFNILQIAELAPSIPTTVQYWVFLAFFVGFAVKVPVFPFHTWLPDAHVEAPTGVSMMLAGILLKLGGYGLFRIAFPSFPDAAHNFAWIVAVLGVINIVYGALAALGQTDIKRFVAYSSISHMGFVLLGLAAMTPAGISGGLYVMISHGLISPLLFFFAAQVFYDRTHTRDMDKMAGLYIKIPVASSLMAFALFANLGLPGLSGFVGEFFSIVGAFGRFTALVAVAMAGIIITAGVNLWVIHRVMMGEGDPEVSYPGIRSSEMAISIPLVALIVGLGVYPTLLMQNLLSPVTVQLVEQLARGGM